MKKQARSPILEGFGRNIYALLSFSGQQYKEIADRREETIAYHEAKKQEARKRKERTARIEAEYVAMLATAREEGQRKIRNVSGVEATGSAYGYGLGYHYSAFSGWGNYVGD
uniref:hypothetical protein n=1 Tax=Bacteroides uniformis TaxID=820 RepID=UPI004024D2E8